MEIKEIMKKIKFVFILICTHFCAHFFVSFRPFIWSKNLSKDYLQKTRVYKKALADPPPTPSPNTHTWATLDDLVHF